MEDGPDLGVGPGAKADSGGEEPAAGTEPPGAAGPATETPGAKDGQSGSAPRSTASGPGTGDAGETPIWVFFAAAGGMVVLALLLALSQAH